ncbi:MAG TPA: superoxide dismutase, partial [Polyangiaceae bacterium]|nr:superoxide dismutase [Polyangiaceae bacterium]
RKDIVMSDKADHDLGRDVMGEVSRRAALHGVIALGGLWFLPMAGCERPLVASVPQPDPNPHPSSSSPMEKEPAMPTEYTLPPLSYAYDALEPHIDAQTLRLHHDMHHAGYVKGANAALANLEQARKSGDYNLVDLYSKKLAFHLSGHLLHSLFWENMAPVGKGGEPSKPLDAAIRAAFGSLEAMKAQMSAVAVSVEGSGWAVLGYHPIDQQLSLLQCENHEKKAVWGTIPLLVVDVWEHAYYLKYQNKRADFVAAWWNLVHWNDVSARYAKAKTLTALR